MSKKNQRETLESSAQFSGLSDPTPDSQSAIVALCHLNELGLITVRFRSKKSARCENFLREDEFQLESIEETCRTAFTTFGRAFFAACAPNSNAINTAKTIDGWQLLSEVREIANDAAESASSAGRSAGDAWDRLDNFKAADL